MTRKEEMVGGTLHQDLEPIVLRSGEMLRKGEVGGPERRSDRERQRGVRRERAHEDRHREY